MIFSFFLMAFLFAELNELEVRPPTTHVSIVGDTTKELDVQVKPSFADHPAVVGPRYIPEELYISTGNFLGYHTSGVLGKLHQDFSKPGVLKFNLTKLEEEHFLR